MIKKSFLYFLAGSGLLLAAGVANSSILLNFDGSISTENTGSTATALLELFDGGTSGGGNVMLQITLTNTTETPVSSNLRGIFFDLAACTSWECWFARDPNNDGLAWVVAASASFNPFGSFDLCGQTEQNGPLCNQGIPSGGLDAPPPSSDYFQLGLSGLADAAAYELAFNTLYADTSAQHACVRFQDVNNDATGKTGLSDKVCGTPVPGPLALMSGPSWHGADSPPRASVANT